MKPPRTRRKGDASCQELIPNSPDSNPAAVDDAFEELRQLRAARNVYRAGVDRLIHQQAA